MTNPLAGVLGLDYARVAEVVGLLAARGETVAAAESLTAGLLTAALTTVPGASAAVRGGLVVYATDLKHRLARVPADLLAAHGAVHPEVASALASGVRDVCGADWGLGLTGVAGPDPQDGVAPGTVYFGIARSGAATSHRFDIDGDRHAVRSGAVRLAIDHLHRALTT